MKEDLQILNVKISNQPLVDRILFKVLSLVKKKFSRSLYKPKIRKTKTICVNEWVTLPLPPHNVCPIPSRCLPLPLRLSPPSPSYHVVSPYNGRLKLNINGIENLYKYSFTIKLSQPVWLQLIPACFLFYLWTLKSCSMTMVFLSDPIRSIGLT